MNLLISKYDILTIFIIMEKEKLLKLIKRLSGNSELKGKTPTEVGDILSHRDSLYFESLNRLNGEDTVLLYFLIPLYVMDKDISKMYDYIKSNLYTYSTVEITQDYVYVTCGSCGGDGEYDCNECGGSGEVDCDECNGDGEDSDGETCNNCQGGGKLECEECYGRGTDECYDCSGNGEIEDNSEMQGTQSYFLSYNQKIYEKLELLDDDDIIDYDSELSSYDLNKDIKTLRYRNEDVKIDDSELNADTGDVVFLGVSKDLDFYGSGANIFLDNFDRFSK